MSSVFLVRHLCHLAVELATVAIIEDRFRWRERMVNFFFILYPVMEQLRRPVAVIRVFFSPPISVWVIRRNPSGLVSILTSGTG